VLGDEGLVPHGLHAMVTEKRPPDEFERPVEIHYPAEKRNELYCLTFPKPYFAAAASRAPVQATQRQRLVSGLCCFQSTPPV
jgi:hypothetical protein